MDNSKGTVVLLEYQCLFEEAGWSVELKYGPLMSMSFLQKSVLSELFRLVYSTSSPQTRNTLVDSSDYYFSYEMDYAECWSPPYGSSQYRLVSLCENICNSLAKKEELKEADIADAQKLIVMYKELLNIECQYDQRLSCITIGSVDSYLYCNVQFSSSEEDLAENYIEYCEIIKTFLSMLLKEMQTSGELLCYIDVGDNNQPDIYEPGYLCLSLKDDEFSFEKLYESFKSLSLAH